MRRRGTLPRHREERLVGEQLDAARGVEQIGDVDLLALALEVGIGAERAGRARIGGDAVVRDPDLAGLARLRDLLVTEGVGAFDLVIVEALRLLVVVEARLGEGLADVAVVHPLADVERLHAVEPLQHLGVLAGVAHELRLDRRVDRHDAAGAEEDVDHLLVDPGPARDLLRRELRVLAHPGVGLEDRLDVGDDDLGVFLGEIGSHHDAVPGRDVGLDAVEDLARKAAERQQLGERHEVGVGVDLLLLQIGRAHFRRLADQTEVIGRPVAVLHRLEDHAVGRRPERHAHHLVLEIGELEIGRVLVDHEAVARAIHVVGGNRDELAAAFRVGLEGEAVHHQRIVAHGAELQLVRHHAVGDRRARGEVVPFELEFHVGVFAVFRQVLLEELELADDDARRHRVGGGVLGADADGDGLRGSRTEPTGQHCERHDGHQGRWRAQGHESRLLCRAWIIAGRARRYQRPFANRGRLVASRPTVAVKYGSRP